MTSHKLRLALMVSAAACWGLLACASSTSETQAGTTRQATSPPTAVDPNCTETGEVRDVLPSGACVQYAECRFTNSKPECLPGQQYVINSPNQYECACPDGVWQCRIVGGSLGVSTCPGYSPPDDSGAQVGVDSGDGGLDGKP